MRKLILLLFLSMPMLVCITGNATALTLGQNITMGKVPEPATIFLSGFGLLCIGILMRRRFIK